ncbi:hypothetical protein ABZ924_18075 [Streptomyces sp. NPDC046876]|uniref:hypothetical protein n=1 Tax=Streptomyces sp. NPDC046876 TaxID=3155616 RepID=UPI003406A392
MTRHLLPGLAANPALPPALLTRLVILAATAPQSPDPNADPDAEWEVALALAGRADLRAEQIRALAALDACVAEELAREGHQVLDVDPLARPSVALALLDSPAPPTFEAPEPEGAAPAIPAPPAFEARGFGGGAPAAAAQTNAPGEAAAPRREPGGRAGRWARALAAHPDPDVRRRLASCPDLPPAASAALAADPDPEVVAELALWTTDPATAARLAAHPHAEVRRSAAGNPTTPPAALAALITGEGLAPPRSCLVCDREPVPFTHPPDCPRTDCDLLPDAACSGAHESTAHDILQQAARNPATPPAAAAGLAGHPSALVRWALAERADLPQELYAGLAADPVPGTRWEVAGNPGIGEPLIRALAADPASTTEALRRLAHHPRLPLDLLPGLASATRIGSVLLPRIAAATAAELAELASSPHARVRMLVAERHDLPDGLRDVLAADPDAKVVKAVAPHPGLSEEQLRAMVALHGVQVLARVAANPDAPAGLLEELARHDPPVRRALRKVAVHPHAPAGALLVCLQDERARCDAAAHPALPPSVLVVLLADTDLAVARAAAANPSLPPRVMEELVDGRAPAAGPR